MKEDESMKEVKVLDRIKDEIMETQALPEEIKTELVWIYEKYREKGLEDSPDEEMRERTEAVLEKMFKSPFDYSVPMSFVKSNIGKVLFKIMLEVENLNELMYGATECAILSGKSRSMMAKYFDSGVIRGSKVGGKLYAQEEAVIQFLTSAGRNPITLTEARDRIKYLRELKDKGLKVEEIKKEFGYKKSWMN